MWLWRAPLQIVFHLRLRVPPLVQFQLDLLLFGDDHLDNLAELILSLPGATIVESYLTHHPTRRITVILVADPHDQS